jgi:hypothetical protein
VDSERWEERGGEEEERRMRKRRRRKACERDRNEFIDNEQVTYGW